MPRDTLTGSRIRERRETLGLKQAELARHAGISASYLNLIEHNRRRIGGKLLLNIASALDIEPALLTEGAEATLINALRGVAADLPEHRAEVARTDEFAGRFPGWAALLAGCAKRIDQLEQAVATLTDRLTHDPHLAASLHEMLTTVTAIHSAASILADSADLEPEWRDRFHRNINEDSARLAETSNALVRYLDAAEDAGAALGAPQEETDAFLARNNYAFADVETGAADPRDILDAEGDALSLPARKVLMSMFRQLMSDAQAAPAEAVITAMSGHGADPFAVARDLGVDPLLAMRRMAAWAPQAGIGEVGLVICDVSGALVFRQPVTGFPLPRFGSGCPMLPLYQALIRPMLPVAAVVSPNLRNDRLFRTFAFAQPSGPLVANRPPLMRAQMLIVPQAGANPAADVTEIGVSCRICARDACPGRREPSILRQA